MRPGSRDRLGSVNFEPTGTSGLPPEEAFPMPEIDANGVDRSQIRHQLELTPIERLKAVESFLTSSMLITL